MTWRISTEREHGPREALAMSTIDGSIITERATERGWGVVATLSSDGKIYGVPARPSGFHPIFGRDPTKEERHELGFIRRRFADLFDELLRLPENRERELALTALEDSCMRAVRAVLEGGA